MTSSSLGVLRTRASLQPIWVPWLRSPAISCGHQITRRPGRAGRSVVSTGAERKDLRPIRRRIPRRILRPILQPIRWRHIRTHQVHSSVGGAALRLGARTIANTRRASVKLLEPAMRTPGASASPCGSTLARQLSSSIPTSLASPRRGTATFIGTCI